MREKSLHKSRLAVRGVRWYHPPVLVLKSEIELTENVHREKQPPIRARAVVPPTRTEVEKLSSTQKTAKSSKMHTRK
jgi:hypothetical protein